MQRPGHEHVARAAPAAAAAVREQHDAGHAWRHGQAASQGDRAGGHQHLMAGAAVRGRPEQPDHLGVGGLREVLVPLADGVERLRRLQADHPVRHLAQRGHGAARRDRDGQNDPGRAMRPGDLAGGPGRGPGGDAVVHHDRGPPGHRRPGPVQPVALGPAAQLSPLPLLDLGEHPLADLLGRRHLGVDQPDAVLADGPHGQLGLGGQADLTDQDHVEREAQRLRDLVADRDATPGQAEHDGIGAAHPRQHTGQPPPRIGTVEERHDPPTPPVGPSLRAGQPRHQARRSTAESAELGAEELPGALGVLAPGVLPGHEVGNPGFGQRVQLCPY